MNNDITCSICGTEYDELTNCIGDYTETEGYLLCKCPNCGKEVEILQ